MFGLMSQTCTSLLHILAVLSLWFRFNKGADVSYLGIRWEKQEADWHWIMRTASICTAYKMVLQWWNQGKWEGKDIEHAWEPGHGIQFWSENLKDTERFEDVCKWDNIQTNVKYRVGQCRLGHLVPNRDQRWAFVNMVMKHQGLYYWW